MSSALHLLLCCLAVYRLSELITVDNGPWHVFRRLRTCSSHPMWCELMSCFYCQTMWWAALFAGMSASVGSIVLADGFLWWMAIAGGSVVIRQTVRPRT